VTVASIAVDEALLVLKILFLVLLYLFIWKIVRSAARDVRLPQESFVLAPSQARDLAALRDSEARSAGRLVVVNSPALEEGEELELDSSALLLGRGSRNDIDLGRDEFASTEHARVEPRRDGVWLEDVGSTNGTYLNGIRLTRPKRLTVGDVVRIGETELRYDA
jgi:hypothetical protein